MEVATTHPRSECKECIILGACGIALVLCMPLIALAIFFVIRPVVIIGLVVAVVALASPWVIAPRLRGRWAADVAPEHAYHGFRLARDVGVHPGHTWAWITESEAVVGADDIVQAEVGPLDEVDLPSEGRFVRQGDALFSLRSGARRVELPAPISGTVVRVNPRAAQQPDIVNSRPFTLGWIARIRTDETLCEDRRELRFGRRAWRWFRAEVDRVLDEAAAAGGGERPEASEDEGWLAIAPGLHRRLTEAAWDRLRPRTPMAASPGRGHAA